MGEEVKVGADEVGCYVNEFGVGGLGFLGFRVFEGKADGMDAENCRVEGRYLLKKEEKAMAKRAKVAESSGILSKMRPALTPEARENQMIALAMDLVERRLRDGSASSQETTHFLKLAASKEIDELNLQLAQKELELKEAKKQSIYSAERIEALYNDAMEAMRRYSGHGDDEY